MSLKPETLKDPLRACGYTSELLRSGFTFGENRKVPLVGFALPPVDSRSACIAVLSSEDAAGLTVEGCKPLGAPIVFVCVQDTLQWWKQGVKSPEYLGSVPAVNLQQFFETHRNEFSPEAVYRAKTWGRFRREYQLSFVDLGLMPLVEEEVGRSIGQLIEQNVSDLKGLLGWKQISNDQGQWLLQTVFWLVSAKILHDKKVERFKDLDLTEVEDVFSRLAAHYGTESLEVGSKRSYQALRESAHAIQRFSSLTLATTESLAYVYENTLISKETRSSLGTHSTPPFLVDYIVGNLTEWIQEIPVDERSVYEPACGHAAFLVSAMRLLTEMLPDAMKKPSRRGPYLRHRLHGNDIDSFALELARLSLTLTDIPNPDGWDLKLKDMFVSAHLSEQAQKSNILLANPPFDNFEPSEQESYRKKGARIRHINKSAEMLWRTLPDLPEGAVFGVVLPQSFLHSENAKDVREFLVRHCELKEICLFPDKIFSFSDAESAIVLGRRKQIAGAVNFRYRRIRERELPSFRSEYAAPNTRIILQSRFSRAQSYSLRVPDLEEVWVFCADYQTVGDIAAVSKGLDYYGELPLGKKSYSEEFFPESRRGFVQFGRDLKLHELPKYYWMNLDQSVISSARSGTAVETPQVLLNYAPASRGPWRLKALIDREGHSVTSRFITVRPRSAAYSLETLWALLNSPVANAYAFSHLGKRDNLVGKIRKIPIPKVNSFETTENAVRAYLSAISSGADPQTLRKLLLRVDANVLRLYSLPLALEQSLLEIFTNWKRVGVQFMQSEYLPDELRGRIRFFDFLQFEEDWLATNRERGRLIDKNIAGTLSSEDQVQLNSLQAYADYHIKKVAPRPSDLLDRLENNLVSTVPAKGNP